MYHQLCVYFALYKRNSVQCDDVVHIDYVRRYLPAETEIIDFIHDAFSASLAMEKQYRVLNYRIDLYVIDANIAIECDEYDHVDRDQEYEKQRELDICAATSCKFIRFDPYATDFQLANLMAKIIAECSILRRECSNTMYPQ